MSRSDVEALAAQVVLGGFAGPTLTSEETRFLSSTPILGYTLFGRNLAAEEPASNLKSLLAQVIHARKTALDNPPPLVAIDQEGGRVSRLKPLGVPNPGPAFEIFRDHLDQHSQLFSYGAQVGRFLKDLGIHLNFAPVVDLLDCPEQIAIGDRCFDSHPQQCSQRAGAYLLGLQSQKVHGCLKHFPGQGKAKLDTHTDACLIDTTYQELQNHELVPYIDLVPQAHFVMASHCVYPEIDLNPVYLSKFWLEDVLRKECGFKGVVVSDDLTMSAVGQNGMTLKKTLCNSILSGVDLFLACRGLDFWKECIGYLTEAANESLEVYDRLLKSQSRIHKHITSFSKSSKNLNPLQL